MGWSYRELSLQDLVKLIKNFIDMLILASGYQSTGRLAHWDSRNIKKCFQWALFLENVLKDLIGSVDYQDSVKELDAALYDLTSNPYFPQGLAPLSCTTLSSARDLLLKHLIYTLPLRESHLKAIITASVETDFSKLKRIDNDCLDVYLEKLMRKNPSEGINLCETRNFMEVSNISSPDGDFSVLAVEQLGRRQLAVSRLSAVETGLECLLKTIGQSMHEELGNTSNSEPTKHSTNIMTEDMPVEPIVWNRWRSRSLSYVLDKRTIRLLSGANLICSAPENQWTQMFERLNVSAEADELSETIELLLLGCIADKWNGVIEHVMSRLFRSYLFELESQFRGNSLATRRCNCIAGAVRWLRECGAFTFSTSVDPMPHDCKEVRLSVVEMALIVLVDLRFREMAENKFRMLL
ncbi:acid phosphatase 1 [Phtheirospermum japonicum]|uniref:Acid phosphatase 1 n=1 Tax=Phtheirospermum japonicum TaxID=374723 RepID=A0A830BDS9_9LAMI|nr:acid phosphatase 1 [Phtheirospermum japonicum]